MSDTINNLSILVDLDSLLDVRLVLMDALDSGYTRRLLEDGTYHTRLFDSVRYTSPELFNRIYEHRNSSMLEGALPTDIYDTIFDYITQVKHTALSESSSEINVVVNLHPYRMTSEMEEVIVKGVAKRLNNVVEVTSVDMNPSELTPLFVSKHYGMMIMYDGLRWIDYHATTQALAKMPIPDMVLLTPMLIRSKDMLAHKEYIKFFEDIAKQIGVLVNIVFEHPGIFSAKLPKKK